MSRTAEHEATARIDRNEISVVAIRCPRCGQQIGEAPSLGDGADRLVCGSCLLQLCQSEGIWNALLPEREEYFRNFVSNYESIRAAEGRGSRNAEFYLALPERDLSGRNQIQWNIRRHTYECIFKQILPNLERRGGSQLDVLDLGAGNGWLSYRLALMGHRPVAVDLLTNSMDGLGAASHYRTRIPHLFPRFRAELDKLPFANAQFDSAIFNASFHYSENYELTLGEALRCLRPGGSIVIADSAWYSSERNGDAMLQERKANFERAYGFPSDALASLEFLTDERLTVLERHFGIRWRVYEPRYGWRWKLRPLVAKLRGRREPSRFRIYVAEVAR